MKVQSLTRLALATLMLAVSASTVLAQVKTVPSKESDRRESDKVKTVPFNGSFDGHESDTVQGGSLLVDGSGAGTALPTGRFTQTWKTTVDLATGLSSGGVFQLVAGNGDVLNGVFVGRGTPTETLNVAHIVELVTIAGGTGRFEGATGEFTLDRLIDQSTGLTSGSLTGTISTPRSSK